MLDRRANIEISRARIRLRRRAGLGFEMGFPARIPNSVTHLDIDVIAETLVRHGANVRAAAFELRVPPSDLRHLTLVDPALIRAALEAEELRLDKAEQIVDEALASDVARRRETTAFFILRNATKARRRGWNVPSASAADINLPPQETRFVWRSGNPAEAAEEEEEQVARLTAEGKKVIQFSWGEPQERGEDDDANTFVRDGVRLPLPRYGRGGDDAIEGELAKPTSLIEQAAETGSAEEPAVVPGPMPELEPAPASPALPDPAVCRERERVDDSIRNRLIAYPLAVCFRCRRPFVAGQDWQEVSNGEARARFHWEP